MANYPSIPQSTRSRRTPVNGKRVQRSVSGKARARNYYTGREFDFEIVHSRRTQADVDTIEAWYAANKDQDNVLTWNADSTTYDVITTEDEPEIIPVAGVRFDIICRLTGRAQ